MWQYNLSHYQNHLVKPVYRVI
uniref:Uncharacterized protein n=1 Tax=Arundo donax TaxID=35708 RepID=A0A0A9ABV3_ARUDO